MSPSSLRRASARGALLLLLVGALTAPALAQNVTDLYVHDAQGQLAIVDVSNGAVTFVGDLGVVLTDIAFAPDGRLFGLDFTTFYEIDPLTAATTTIGNHGIPGGNALVFAADGTLYAMGNTNTQLYELDPETAAPTALGDVGATSAGDLAFFGGELYLATLSHQLLHIDLGPPASGAPVGPFGFSNVFALATSDAGLFGVAGTEIFSVDPATGAGTFLSDYGAADLDVAYGSSFQAESFQACPLTPVAGCKAVASAKLSFNGKALGREKLALAMKRVADATVQGDFGDPVAGDTRYEICLYDAAGDLARGLGVARAGDVCGPKGKPCWKAKGATGWSYKNPGATPSGVRSMQLIAGPAGKGRLVVKASNQAKKLQTGLPASIGLALAGETSVLVQVTASDAQCYEATLTTILKAEPTLFKGKTP